MVNGVGNNRRIRAAFREANKKDLEMEENRLYHYLQEQERNKVILNENISKFSL